MADKNKMTDKNKCDVRAVLINLITKQSMPGFDYNRTTFTFNTVFHQSPFSCCACNCGIALERMEFIDDSGNIIDDVFERMVDCIANGECPHVKGMPKKYIAKAKLYALHVVAAVGCIEESERSLSKEPHAHYRGYGRLLNLGTFEIAMLRQGVDSTIVNRRYNIARALTHVSKELELSVSNSECVELDQTDLVSYCIKRQYFAFLGEFIKVEKGALIRHKFEYGSWDIDRALQTAFHHNSTELVDIIVNDKELYIGNPEAYTHCLLAIIYNQPEILNRILGYMHSLGDSSTKGQETESHSGGCQESNVLDDWHGGNAFANGVHGENADAGWHGENEDGDWHGWNADDDWHGENANGGLHGENGDDDWHGENADDNGWHGGNEDNDWQEWNPADNGWHGVNAADDLHEGNAADNGWHGEDAADNGWHAVNGGIDWHGESSDDNYAAADDDGDDDWQEAIPLGDDLQVSHMEAVNIAEICKNISLGLHGKKESQKGDWRHSDTAKRLYEFCEALERDECKVILETHGISFETLHLSETRKLSLVLSLLVNGTVEFLDMIGQRLLSLSDGHVADAIKATKNRQDLVRFEWGLVEHKIEIVNVADMNDINYRVLNHFIQKNPPCSGLTGCADKSKAELYEQQRNDDNTLRVWLDIGLGPVAGEGDCISSYLRWLESEMDDDYMLQVSTVRILCARRCLEALVYANPDVTLNKDAVTLGLKINKCFYSGEQEGHWFSPARYVLDGRIHGICGHDVLALNMTTPFLLECGFIAPRSLTKMCRDRTLHPALNGYVQHTLQTPKSLQVSCRDALRRQFVGPKIHRLMAACRDEIPSDIKDFILLKPLLRCIPKRLLDKLSEKFSE